MVESSQARLRLLAYAGLYFFWGTTFLGIRMGVKYGLPPLLLSATRQACAGILLLILARSLGASWPTRRQALGAGAMGVLFLGFCNGICAWALRYVESGYGTLVIAGVPLVALLYRDYVQGQSVRPAELGLVLLGLAGVGVLMSPAASAAHSSSPWGIVALLVATVVWAITMTEKKRFPQPGHPLMLTAFQMFGGSLALGPVALGLELRGLDLAAVGWQAWAAWGYLVIFGSCVGYGAFSYLLDIDTPQRVGTYAYVNPVVAVLAGHWLLGEEISRAVLVSGALIVLSVAGLLRLERGGARGKA